MRKTSLTDLQIEICDITLKNNQKRFLTVFPEAEYTSLDKYKKQDRVIACNFLRENKLAESFDLIVLTDLGIKYSDKGILKFIKDKRRDDLLMSPLFKTWVLIIPIIISLVFSIVNYCQNQENKRNDSDYIKKAELDSILNKQNSFMP